jgi:hypothetical protein
MSANATYYFDTVIYNEIDTAVYKLFIAIQDDNFIKNLKTKWITREKFFEILKKENRTIEEEMILTTWSFGNNREGYIYGEDIYLRKYLTHHIILAKNENDYKELIKEYNKKKVAHFEKYDAVWDVFLVDDDWEIFKKKKNKRFYKFGANKKCYRKFYKPFDLEKIIEDR